MEANDRNGAARVDLETSGGEAGAGDVLKPIIFGKLAKTTVVSDSKPCAVYLIYSTVGVRLNTFTIPR